MHKGSELGQFGKRVKDLMRANLRRSWAKPFQVFSDIADVFAYVLEEPH